MSTEDGNFIVFQEPGRPLKGGFPVDLDDVEAMLQNMQQILDEQTVRGLSNIPGVGANRAIVDAAGRISMARKLVDRALDALRTIQTEESTP